MIEAYKRNVCFVELDWHHRLPHLHCNEKKTSCEHKGSCVFLKGVEFNGILEMGGWGCHTRNTSAFELKN